MWFMKTLYLLYFPLIFRFVMFFCCFYSIFYFSYFFTYFPRVDCAGSGQSPDIDKPSRECPELFNLAPKKVHEKTGNLGNTLKTIGKTKGFQLDDLAVEFHDLNPSPDLREFLQAEITISKRRFLTRWFRGWVAWPCPGAPCLCPRTMIFDH